MLTSLRKFTHIGCCLWMLASCRPATPPSEASLSIFFTGDVLLDRGVRRHIEQQGIDHLFDSVSVLFRHADATVINLECPLTDTCSPLHKKYIFRADAAWAHALAAAGVTHAAMANNHTMDQGRKGLEDTDRHLTDAGITPIGYAPMASESCRPVLIEKGNITVAIFNSVPLPLENWVYLEDRPGICQQPPEEMEEEIRNFKRQHPHAYAVALLHWGVEYQPLPTPMQRRSAHRLIDAGADAVIGHHPHVVQPAETYRGKPIYYSLGNFVFDQRRPETSHCLVVQLNFTDSACTAQSYPMEIQNCQPLPCLSVAGNK